MEFERVSMFSINHAVLHVLDFESCVTVISQEELDLENKSVKSYVARMCKHALGGMSNRRGDFLPDSPFAGELAAYLCGDVAFMDLSAQIADFLSSEFGRMEKPTSCDVLVVDFEDEAPAHVRDEGACGYEGACSDEAECDGEGEGSQVAAAPAPAAEEAAAYAARSSRYFAILLLESKPAFMHEVARGDAGGTVNSIERHHAILPNPSQKLSSYAFIDVRSRAIRFLDKERTVAGEPRWVLPEGLLSCTNDLSSKELFDATIELVSDVAEEFGVNSAEAIGRAKAYMAANASDDDEVPFDEFVDDVFADEGPRRRFEEAAASEHLGEGVRLERNVASRAGRNHKIVTDTGIVVTFPAEYSRNTELIEFSSTPNGLIKIELKNIGSIENR